MNRSLHWPRTDDVSGEATILGVTVIDLSSYKCSFTASGITEYSNLQHSTCEAFGTDHYLMIRLS